MKETNRETENIYDIEYKTCILQSRELDSTQPIKNILKGFMATLAFILGRIQSTDYLKEKV